MRIKIVINTWTDIRTDEERNKPFHYKGYQSTSQVWGGELDILSDMEYLTKISIIAEGVEHPICDIPFAIGIGHWMWCPPEMNTEEDENVTPGIDGITSGRIVEQNGAIPPLFRSIASGVLPTMAISTSRWQPRTWLPFRRNRKRKGHGSSGHKG
jgi:hypothetical protein